MIDNCSGTSVENYDVNMFRMDDEGEYYFTKDSIVEIEKGYYLLMVNSPTADHFRSFSLVRKFSTDSVYTVNLELPRIMKKYTRELHYPKDLGFYYCDRICNGQMQDYYSNGNLRMEASFKDGTPIKEIKKYNQKGDLVEIEIYDKDGLYKKSIYPDYEAYIKNN